MATFKFSGNLGRADDTQLWKEMLTKERGANQMHQAYNGSQYFTDTHASRFGANRHNQVNRNANLLSDVLRNKLSNTQVEGFHKTEYLKDGVDHFTSPPYCIIKPGYRASEPFPNDEQIKQKHLYSFKPFGNQRVQRSMSNMYKSTFRNTMQADAPYHRGHLSPFNVKHGLVDPSHTYMNPADDHEHKDMNFTAYDWKNGKDKYSKQLQHNRRETFNIHGQMVLRLPERRDFLRDKEIDPVANYRNTQRANKNFFSLEASQKIDLDKFGQNNYLTAPKDCVGVTKHKNYLMRKENSWQGDLMDQSSKRGQSIDANRENSKAKYKIMREMLQNEKEATKNLGDELKNLSQKIHTDKKKIQSLVN